MSNQKDRERRAEKRVGLTTQVVYGPSAQWSRGARLRTAEGINISQSGLCIQTKSRLSLWQIIRLNLPVNGAATPITSPTLAECCWIEPQQKQYRVGLRFLV
jgi:hypothetical protein